jgi:predicted MFS family arabinose efflux permease
LPGGCRGGGSPRGQRSALSAAISFCLLGLAAGVRTPASAGLGLEQLPGHPAVMMASRTAATQLGYLLGAVIGGLVIGGPGYGALGLVLGVVMAASAALVLRVNDPTERRTDDTAPQTGRTGTAEAS